jgi:hypothetical protein
MDNSRLLDEAIQHPGLVLLLVLGGSLIAQVLYNSLAPVKGLFSRRCSRDGLKKRVSHSRLGKMLTRRDIDLQYYLFNQRPSDIERHIRNCKRCDSLDQCDCYLDNRKMDSNIDLPFCQSNDSILKIKNQQDNLYMLRNKQL